MNGQSPPVDRQLPAARENGVSIAAGADIGNRYPHGSNARELEFMVREAMTRTTRSAAATGVAARAIHREGQVGRRSCPAQLADLLVVGRRSPRRTSDAPGHGRGLTLCSRAAARCRGRCSTTGVPPPRPPELPMTLVIRGWTILTPAGDGVRSGNATSSSTATGIGARGVGRRRGARRDAPGRPRHRTRAARSSFRFVDAHAHFYGTLIPGLIDDRLRSTCGVPCSGPCTAGGPSATPEVTTLVGAFRMMRNGTTTVLENGAQGIAGTEPAIARLLEAGVRAVVGR